MSPRPAAQSLEKNYEGKKKKNKKLKGIKWCLATMPFHEGA